MNFIQKHIDDTAIIHYCNKRPSDVSREIDRSGGDQDDYGVMNYTGGVVMKKLMCVCMLITGLVISQSVFAQDTATVKKAVKVVKVKNNSKKEKKECTEKMACSKDKKCCDKCKGEKCDGSCCASCAGNKKGGKEKCEMGKKNCCAMDSTAKCSMKDMKNHMGKKPMMKKAEQSEEKK